MNEQFIRSRLSGLREEKQVSERKMSLDLGHSTSYIRSITSGRTLPSMSGFLYICEYLGITPMGLLLRDAVYKMIESHGEQAVIEDFSDGQTCLSQLGSRKFNILFLDIEMPGVDGFSMAGKMQKSYPNIVLIFVSSHESLVFQSYEYDTFWFMRKSALITDLKKSN